ncbi:MAG: hypothetical protein AABY22_36520 [Nanoarchaeota archaeon]
MTEKIITTELEYKSENGTKDPLIRKHKFSKINGIWFFKPDTSEYILGYFELAWIAEKLKILNDY